MQRSSVVQGRRNVSGNRKSGQSVNIVSSQASYGSHGMISRASRANMGYGGSTSRKNVVIDDAKGHRPGGHKAVVQVFDDHGQDVTPRSLLPQDPNALRKNQSNMNTSDSSSIGTPSDMFSQSIYGASTLQTSYAPGFSRSMFGSVIGSASRVSLDSIADEIAEPSHANDFSSGLGDIQTRRADVKEQLSEADLEKEVTLMLSETDTIWHLDIPGTSVAKDSDLAQEVTERNEKYDEVLKTRVGNDMFIQRGMQTFNDAPKTKEMQTVPVGMDDVGCMATTWDMYDTYSKEDGKLEDKESEDLIESLSRPGSPAQQGRGNNELPVVMEREETSMVSLRKGSSIGSLMTESRGSFMTTSNHSDAGDTTDRDSVSQADIDLQAEKILKLDSMKKNLFTMERAVVQNIFHPKQAAYRGLPVVDTRPDDAGKDSAKGEKGDLETKLGANLGRLWAFSSNLTKGKKVKKVNCMAWNKHNQDLLAVGYGQFGLTGHDGGLVCCWSLKNPEFPERVYHLNTAVTALDFSAAHPNLLAAGLYDGTIAILNVRHTKDTPVLDSSDSAGKHAGPIWQLKWVDRDKGTGEDKGEVLVSASADGRVTQWSIRKGFEFQDLMKLKRLNVAKQIQTSKQKSDGAKKGDALISRFVAGLCFDFHPNDGNTYLAGTEEGHIHRCSCSYNEQFLDTYSGHTGPVYRLLWCPFLSDVFVSCSSDWSIRLWDQNKQQPVVTLHSAQKAINDIDWSPTSATVIGAVNDSQIEIWDLSHGTLDPLIINATVDPNISLSSITFSPNSEAVLVGDSEGLVTVYQLRSMPALSEQQTEILSKIMNAAGISQPVEERNEKEIEEELVDR